MEKRAQFPYTRLTHTKPLHENRDTLYGAKR